MTDGEAKFAAELGRSVGRMDWWNLKAEHTAYEWAAQVAMYEVDPFGERRADMRAGVMTANLMAQQTGKQVPADEFRELVKTLSNYLPTGGDEGEAADLQALEIMRRGEQWPESAT